ncbi:MAG TPA: hypothetical protein PKN33_20230 [Phycisphaerae bacterium]|nr:hypothetical protein [Phycisphaerae bacterium]
MRILNTLGRLLGIGAKGQSAVQVPNKPFKLPRGVTLCADEEMVLAFPQAILGEDEVMGSVIHMDDDAEFSLDQEHELVLLKLRKHMRVKLTKSAEGFIIPDSPEDKRPRRLRVIIPKTSAPPSGQ